MKLLCDVCEQVVPLGQVRQEGGALVFQCPGCGAQGRIGAEPAPATAAPVPAAPAGEAPRLALVSSAPAPQLSLEPPSTHCPKCIEPREESALACPRCGLVFANFEPAQVEPSAELVEGWRALSSRWEEPAEHERLIRQAVQRGEVTELARLYRIHLATHPEDAQALAARERIISLVASAALPEKREAPAASNTLRPIGYAVIALLAIALLGLIFRMASR